MKTSIKTMAALTAILAGTAVAEAHPQQRRQQQDRPDECPHCSKQEYRRQRPQHPGQNYRQQGPRYDQPGPPRHRQPEPRCDQARPPRHGEYGPRHGQHNPQFRKQDHAPRQGEYLQQRRERVLERFDRNGDGRLSEKERKAMKKAWKKRHQVPQGSAPEQPAPTPPVE